MNNKSTPDTRSSISARVEQALHEALDDLLGVEAPPDLAAAMRHAVLAGGSRFRPRLLLTVAQAHGAHDTRFAAHAAAAVELLHAASLVHDDLPAFDDASQRRGVPTVHKLHGQALAILAGDALIVGAFQVLHAGAADHPRGKQAMQILFRAGGAAQGLAKGQALELSACATQAELERYHHAKTGVLFEAATTLGALSANADAEAWRDLGRELGLLYQAIDDVLDVCGDAQGLGKDVGNDARHARPNLVHALEPLSGPRLVHTDVDAVLAARTARLRSAVPQGMPAVSQFVESLLAELARRMGNTEAPQADTYPRCASGA